MRDHLHSFPSPYFLTGLYLFLLVSLFFTMTLCTQPDGKPSATSLELEAKNTGQPGKTDGKRILWKDLPKDGRKVHYLGKLYPSKAFQKIKSRELSLLVKRLKKKYRLKFKMRHSKYFNIAYTCSDKRMNRLQHYLEQFFSQIYPKYFIYEPTAPWNVVYFNTKGQFVKKTHTNAYGYYSPSDKTFYTYSRSGHGTLWHEMIHAFMDSNLDVEPHEWFNEGLASFYEMAFLIKGRVSEGYTNWRMPFLQKAIRTDKFTPLKRFLKDMEMQEDFGYAEARFFFYYLWVHRKMIPFVRGYLYRLAPKYQGTELNQKVVELLKKLSGKSIERINEEYLHLAKRVKKNHKLRRVRGR